MARNALSGRRSQPRRPPICHKPPTPLIWPTFYFAVTYRYHYGPTWKIYAYTGSAIYHGGPDYGGQAFTTGGEITLMWSYDPLNRRLHNITMHVIDDSRGDYILSFLDATLPSGTPAAVSFAPPPGPTDEGLTVSLISNAPVT